MCPRKTTRRRARKLWGRADRIQKHSISIVRYFHESYDWTSKNISLDNVILERSFTSLRSWFVLFWRRISCSFVSDRSSAVCFTWSTLRLQKVAKCLLQSRCHGFSASIGIVRPNLTPRFEGDWLASVFVLTGGYHEKKRRDIGGVTWWCQEGVGLQAAHTMLVAIVNVEIQYDDHYENGANSGRWRCRQIGRSWKQTLSSGVLSRPEFVEVKSYPARLSCGLAFSEAEFHVTRRSWIRPLCVGNILTDLDSRAGNKCLLSSRRHAGTHAQQASSATSRHRRCGRKRFSRQISFESFLRSLTRRCWWLSVPAHSVVEQKDNVYMLKDVQFDRLAV